MMALNPGPSYFSTASVGFQMVLDPQVSLAGHVASLTGATCSLVAIDPTGTRRTFTPIVSGDGTTAVYTSAAGDWPVAGTYRCQWSAQFGASPILPSAVFLVNVGEAL